MGRPQVAYRETITRKSQVETRFVRQTGGRGQYAHVIVEFEPLGKGQGFEFVDKVTGGAIPQEYIPAVAQGIRESMDNGVLGGYPDGRYQGHADGRLVPRGRQLGHGVQDRRLDGASRRRAEGRPGAAGAVMQIEVVVPESSPAM